MAVREGDTTRFDLAKEKAKAVVQGMSMGDTMMYVAHRRILDIQAIRHL